MASSIHAVWLHLEGGEERLGHVTVDVEGIRVRTSVVGDHRKSVERADSSRGNTHLMSEAGPPYDNENPNFIEDWDVSVLRKSGAGQHTIARTAIGQAHQQKEVEN